jgi:hypothetical protein
MSCVNSIPVFLNRFKEKHDVSTVGFGEKSQIVSVFYLIFRLTTESMPALFNWPINKGLMINLRGEAAQGITAFGLLLWIRTLICFR